MMHVQTIQINHTINEGQHIPLGYSIFILDNSTNSSKVLYYREKDCIQKLCKELREIGEELFDTEEKPLIPLTSEQKRFHNNPKRCHICHTKFYSKDHIGGKSINYIKVRDHDYYTGLYRSAAHSICSLRYSTQRDIPVVIHNGSNYDFDLIIKELAEEFRTEIQYNVYLKIKKNTNHLVFQLCTKNVMITQFLTI